MITELPSLAGADHATSTDVSDDADTTADTPIGAPGTVVVGCNSTSRSVTSLGTPTTVKTYYSSRGHRS